MLDAITQALRQSTSLDPQQDQSLAHTGVEFGAGFLPVVGQAMALRDIERARREGNYGEMALNAASLIPGGHLLKMLRGPGNKLIAGRGALNAPHKQLDEAEKKLKAGEIDRNQAWQQYGAHQGYEPSAPMKWEIPDQLATIKMNQNFPTFKSGQFQGKVGDFLEHEEAYKNYPFLRDIDLKVDYNPKLKSHESGGSFMRGVADLGVPAQIEVSGGNYKDILSSLLHEVQHGIQHKEGFSQGASSRAIADALRKKYPNMADELLNDNAYKAYYRNMGEAEARAVEARLLNSAKHNRAVGFAETQGADVPPSKLLFDDFRL